MKYTIHLILPALAFLIFGCSSASTTSGNTAKTDAATTTTGNDAGAATGSADGTTGQTTAADGADGADGATTQTDGTDGATAATGSVDGTDGTTATTATDGTDGTDGATATDGTDGATGVDGTDGATATDGTDGSTGTASKGACDNPADQSILANEKLITDAGLKCGTECFLNSDVAKCGGDCIVKETKVSAGCGKCFGENIVCATPCALDCLADIEAPKCIKCRCENGCPGKFTACAGIEDDSCSK